MGAAASFSILGQTLITGVAPTSGISGDVEINGPGADITALTAAMVDGTMFSSDAGTTGGGSPTTALDPAVQADAAAEFNTGIPGQTSDGTIGPALDGLTVEPGVWDIGAGRLNGGVVTLDGAGIYIFRASSDLISSGSVNLTNGARACDVYWRVQTLATINGSSFVGTILAGTGVHFGDGVSLDGRALAIGGDVTLLNNTISGPSCAEPSPPPPPPPPSPATLNVIKTVVNDNGGIAAASDFTIGVTGTNVSPSSFAGSEAGVEVILDAGDYSVSETAGPSGYLASGSGDCSGTISADETKTCTITNNDIAPQLIVNKIVINDNGGTKVIADFPLFLDGVGVTSGVATTTTVGEHTVSETTDSGYTAVIGGDCAADGTITLALGDIKTCTITNDDIAPSGGGGGGGSTPPPLIDVVKVPNPLSLPNGPGEVVYTYTLTNPGTVPLNNVTMVGDTCSPIVFVSGDTDNDQRLDVNETWIYSCTTTLSETHTNIVTAIGLWGGISASDTANATVVVGIPVEPPLIHVTKVPSPLTLIGGGTVTYTNRVTNPGTVPLNNVRLTDDKCVPVNYVSGDTNSNNMLDVNETWIYVCQMNITQTTVNTVAAEGTANGLTARDTATATVIVSAPGLPNTGIDPDGKSITWNIAILAGIFAVLASLYIVRKKQTT